MKMGITGASLSGKKTVFEALTKREIPNHKAAEDQLGTIDVPDFRIDKLRTMYSPQKTTFAKISFFLPGKSKKSENDTDAAFTGIRSCDALILVVRNFLEFGFDKPDPNKEIETAENEMIFSDLLVVEKRIERVEKEKVRGRTINKEELSLLKKCKELLDHNQPLRTNRKLADSFVLKCFMFLSSKPLLILINNSDDNDTILQDLNIPEGAEAVVLRARLEQEIAMMDAEDSEIFLKEYGIDETAANRVIRQSYELMGLISFFTVGEDEVRAWTVTADTPAPDAGDVIHSDIKKGFIRAEVVNYNDLLESGSYANARKDAKVRLEGKNYQVAESDIIDFRFNV